MKICMRRRIRRTRGSNSLLMALALCLLLIGIGAMVKAGGNIPAPPKDLDVRWASRDFKGAILTWKASAGATSYNIYRSIEVVPQPPPPTQLYQTGVKGTTYEDKQARLGVDTVLVYQVTAVNQNGESRKSNIAKL